MRTCRQCDWECPPHAAFCTNCGTALEATRPPQPQLGDWTLAAGDGSLSGQLKASPVADTPTRSIAGDDKSDSNASSASADISPSATETQPEKPDLPPKEEPKPTLASAISNALDLGGELEETAASFPAQGSAISNARTLVDWKIPAEAVIAEPASEPELEPEAKDESDSNSAESDEQSDDRGSETDSTGAFVSMENPTPEKAPGAPTEKIPLASRLSSKAPGLIQPPADIGQVETVDFGADTAQPHVAQEPKLPLGSTSASADFMAVGDESIDVPIESLDGDDSLAGLSHSLMRPTIAGAMGPGDLDDAHELESVDLESIDSQTHRRTMTDHLGLAGRPTQSETRTPVGEPRFVLRQLGATEKGHRSLNLTSAGLVIGSSEGEVTIEHDPYISPRHAALSIKDGHAEVSDLGSLNGVWIRARREASLRVGDQVMLGEQIFTIEQMPEETAPVKDGAGTRRLGTRLRRSAFGIVLVGWDGLAVGRWVIPEHGCRVGRYAGELVFNDDQLLSATHGLFVPRSDGVVLKDLESANGCWVRVRNQSQLAVGDAVMVGRTVWRVGLAGTTRTSSGTETAS